MSSIFSVGEDITILRKDSFKRRSQTRSLFILRVSNLGIERKISQEKTVTNHCSLAVFRLNEAEIL